MPFKSEAQRKYLWANEPEIARDWTDTYGSGIQAAHGGIIGSVGGTSRQKYQEGEIVGEEMEGAEMEGAEMEGAEMEGAMMQSKEVLTELYEALIAQGLSPQEAMEKIKEMIATAEAEEPETLGPQASMMGEEFPGQEFSGGPRVPAAFGGIMDTYTGRRKYGFGSFFKKAKRAIKKIVKSPIGKAALIAGTMYLTRNMGPIKGAGGWKKYLLGAPTGTGIGAARLGAPAAKTSGLLGIGGPLGKFGLTQGAGSMMPTWLGVGAAATAAPFAMQALGKWEQDELPGMPGGDQKFDFNLGQARKDIASAVASGDYNQFKDVLNQYDMVEGTNIGFWDTLAHGAEGGRVGYGIGGWLKSKLGLGRREGRAEASGDTPPLGTSDPNVMRRKLLDYFQNKYSGGNWRGMFKDQWTSPFVQAAQGGRIGAQEGGLMDLGGMEKDYRDDGGFVPLGGEEKADDVPARLSKNEFVFTADAVRNAGGGDIDRGAEVMENVMKNLEAGGKVSEESQGQGAQDMFKVSERLSEVV